MNKRITFEQFFDKIAWLAITAIGVYASTQLRAMSDAVNTLTTNTAVLIERVGNQSGKIENHEIRIDELEKR